MLEKKGRGWSKNAEQFSYTNKKKKKTLREFKVKGYSLGKPGVMQNLFQANEIREALKTLTCKRWVKT